MNIVDEARVLLEAATPGPWEASPACDYPSPGTHFAWDVVVGRGASEEVVAGAPLSGPDAAFIAAAPRLVAGLLGEIERLYTEVCGLEDVQQLAKWAAETSAAAIKERNEARAALAELVRLKRIKDELIPDLAGSAMDLDYRENQPKAWNEARRIVKLSAITPMPAGGEV